MKKRNLFVIAAILVVALALAGYGAATPAPHLKPPPPKLLQKRWWPKSPPLKNQLKRL